MKTLKSIFQQSFTKEFERAALRHDKQTLVGLIHLIVFATAMIGGTVMYFYDMNSFLSLFLLGFVCFGGWLVNRAGHPTSSAVILIAALLIVIQFNVLAGYGIHDVAIIAWPALIFFSGLLFGWQAIPYVTALIMGLAVVTKILPNAENFSDYSNTGDLIVMQLILLAFSLIAMLILRRSAHLFQRLQRSEERFQAIYNSINDAILIQDPQTGAILNVNEKTLEMFGYTLQEIALPDTLALSSGILPDAQENALEWLKNAVTQKVQQFERQVKDKSGRPFWVDVSMKPATIADQTQILVSVRDISDHKRTENALRESENMLRRAQEIAHIGHFTFNPATGLIEASDELFRIFGLTREQCQFSDFVNSVHPDDRASDLAFLESAVARETNYEHEHRLLLPDGTLKWICMIGTFSNTWPNEPALIIGTVQDITERKRAELQREVLHQVHRAVSGQLDADLVVHSAVETIVRLTGYPHVCIALPDENGAHWVVRGAAGSLAAELGATYPIHQGVIGRAFRTVQTQWVRDILDDPNYVRDVSATDAPALRSEFVAPLRRGDHLLGALNVESDRVDAFSDADARIIQTVADMIALALENSRLYGEAQREIVERRQAEAALRESEERLKEAQRIALIGNWELDLEDNNLTWSDEIYRIFEIDPAKFDASYAAFLGAIHPADRGTVDRAYTASLETRSPYEIDHQLLMPDGRVKYVHEHCETLYDSEGHPLRSVGTVQDITERKRVEQALRENEEKYRRLVDNAPLGIFQASLEGQIISINPAFAHMLGYESPEDAMTNIRNVATDLFVDPNRRAEIIRLMADHPDLRTFENVYLRKDGSAFIGQLNVTLVKDASGRLVRTEGMVEDITERKRAEAKIQATLEEKETLLREVHHRVKNNLQAMIALMEMRASLIPDEGTRQFLKELEGQARTMALVYEQLYQSVNLARVQMALYLQQLTFYIVETFGNRRKVQLNLDLAPIELDVAQAMPCGLIVNELVTNIFKHAFPPGFQGQPAVHITLQYNDNICRLTVADNGVGLPSGYDWQASRSLGLRLVNLWVTHQLGGTLNVNSESGTAYTISFAQEQEESHEHGTHSDR